MPRNTDSRIPATLDTEKLLLHFEFVLDVSAYEDHNKRSRERRRELYYTNHEKRLDQFKRYRDSEKGQATAKAYRDRNREKFNAYMREWRKRRKLSEK